MDPAGSITLLLEAAQAGDRASHDLLYRRVYDELKIVAHRRLAAMGRRGDFDTADVVNAACERLLTKDNLSARNRKHFFYLMSRAMLDVLVEETRRRRARKHG
jgi:hypothetical protein